MTAAFQRMKARMRRSMCSSPGNHGSFSGGMVLMYGLETVLGSPTPSSRARSSSFMSRNRARVRPRSSATISRESTHSAVSWGSMSGSCWLKPSKITIPVSHPPESDFEPAPTVTGCCDEAHGEEIVTTEVYTDGACLGNPGPGGWAWAVPGGRYASGAATLTTNQRMEVHAVLDAVQTLGGPLGIVSDSTYVVHCFRDRWWEGWLARGWKNSAKKPVAN